MFRERFSGSGQMIRVMVTISLQQHFNRQYPDAIGARQNVAWGDTPEGTKFFEEIRDELYEIRGWSLLQEIMEAAFHHPGKENEALAKKKPPNDEEN